MHRKMVHLLLYFDQGILIRNTFLGGIRMKKWWTIPLCVILLAVTTAIASAVQEIKLIVDGKEIQSDIAPQLINGRVFVPVRSVAEALDAEVEWNELNQSVTITRKTPEPQLLAHLPEAEASLYATLHNGIYEGFELRIGQAVRPFPFWRSMGSHVPQILHHDINQDGSKEIIVVLTTNTGTGLYMAEAHVVQADALLKEVYVDNPLSITWKNVMTKIDPQGVTVTINNKPIMFPKEKISATYENWFRQVYFGNQISFKVEDHQLKAFLSAQISPTDYIGEIQISYKYKDSLYQAAEIRYDTLLNHMK